MRPQLRTGRVGVVGLAAAALVIVVAVLAVRADLADHQQVWVTALDVLVGIAFAAGAMFAKGRAPQRTLMLLVGVSWLAGSSWPQTRSVHQGVLALALFTFPFGELRGWFGRVLLVMCLIVGLGTASQVGVAALFAVVAVAVILRAGRRGAVGIPGYSVVSAALLAGMLCAAWLAAPQADPLQVRAAYEGVLLAVGLAFPVATRVELRRQEALADSVLSELGLPLLDGLTVILRRLLGDDSVQVYRWRPDETDYVDGQGRRLRDGPSTGDSMDVQDAAGPVARVVHHSDALDDPSTAEAVASAVRLTVVHGRLQDELRERLTQIQAARLRMLAATERERLAMSSRLGRDVEQALSDARAELSEVDGSLAAPEIVAAVDDLTQGLAHVSTRMAVVVSGSLPVALGGGRLVEAIVDLAAMCPVPVEVVVSGGPIADQIKEAALFYLCSEALVNVTKHAHATRISLMIGGAADEIVVTVTDDGVGGADAQGSGLRGLADRLAGCGGRLQVESAPGAGTTLIATMPT